MTRKQVWRVIRFLPGAFASLALFSSCTTTKTVKIADTEQPLRAELIVKIVRTKPCITFWGGSCSYQEPAIVLRGGLFPAELPYGCLLKKTGAPAGEIATDTSAAGTRVGFRCGKKDGWQVVYVTPRGRSFLECRKYETTVPNWAAIPTLTEAAPGLVQRSCPGVSLENLAAEVQERGGIGAVTDLLLATVSWQARRRVSYDHLQAWDDAYLKLPASEKKRFVPVFRSALLGDSTVLALERALRYADFSDPAYVVAMKARLEKIVNAPPHHETDVAADMMLRTVARSDPQEAARLGCRELEREMKRGALVYLAGAILAVAHARYPCPAVLATLKNSRCDAAFYCPRGQNTRICEPADLAKGIQESLQGPAGALKPNERDRALLAAALALPEAQAILQLWHQRHSYTIDQPAAPACDKLYVLGKKGVPCRCFDSLPASACGTLRNEINCLYRVDDSARRIDGVVSP